MGINEKWGKVETGENFFLSSGGTGTNRKRNEQEHEAKIQRRGNLCNQTGKKKEKKKRFKSIQ